MTIYMPYGVRRKPWVSCIYGNETARRQRSKRLTSTISSILPAQTCRAPAGITSQRFTSHRGPYPSHLRPQLHIKSQNLPPSISHIAPSTPQTTSSPSSSHYPSPGHTDDPYSESPARSGKLRCTGPSCLGSCPQSTPHLSPPTLIPLL